MIEKNIAQAVRLAMEKKGIKGNELALLLGVAPTTVSRWRKNGCDSVSDLIRIAKCCDMTLEQMMKMGE